MPRSGWKNIILLEPLGLVLLLVGGAILAMYTCDSPSDVDNTTLTSLDDEGGSYGLGITRQVQFGPSFTYTLTHVISA